MTALRHPDFRTLWTAGLVSGTGDWLLLVALPILVYQLTGSTLGTALAFLVELAPPILLGALAGRLADRWDRRRALVAICAVQAVVLLPLLAVSGPGDLWIVYAVIAVQATLVTAAEPSRNALLPTLVPDRDLVSANSLLGVNANLGRLVGGPIGGALLVVGGLDVIVVVDVLSFAAAGLLVWRVRARPAPRSRRPAAARSAAVALPSLVRTALLVAGLGAVAQGIFVVLFVPFVAEVLHGDAATTGLLRGVQAVGAIAAGLLLGALTRRCRPGLLAAAGAAAFGLLCLAIWNAPQLTLDRPYYVVLFALVGAPGIVLVTGLTSTLQLATPAGTTGRAFGALATALAGGQAIGMATAGLLGDRLGIVGVLDAQAGLYLVAAAVGALGLLPRGSRSRPAYGRRPVLSGKIQGSPT